MSLSGFSWLDIVIAVVLIFSTVRSARRGFSREVIGLAASVFALLMGMWFYGIVGSFLMPYVNSVRMANLLGFLLVLAGVFLLGWLVSSVVSRFLRTIGLSYFDHLLGGVFGLLRALVVLTALLTAFIAFGPHASTDRTPSAVVNSKLAPYVLEASQVAVAMAPMDLKQSFRKYYSKVKSAVPERGSR